MRAAWILLVLQFVALQVAAAQVSPPLHDQRMHASDLEIGGNVSGLARGSTAYITRDDLLRMPQVTYTVRDDPNFTGPTKISGIFLQELARQLGAAPSSDLVIAICDDRYRANYPASYLQVHRPVLVLNVNGKPPAGWPKDAHEHAYDMGPYMISHPHFTPNYNVLSNPEEAQIPWGVMRVEFRPEKIVFGAIAPRGPRAQNRDIQDGFRIAKQNCFRCHNAGPEGGQKSGRSWNLLSNLAAQSPENFAAYIHNPLAGNPKAQMPGNPDYDGATLRALTAYFQTFTKKSKP